MSNLKKQIDLPIFSFDSQDEFAEWMEKNYETPGVWIKFFKKNSGIKSITYDEALDVALCYGWIDSQSRSLDEKSYLQKFTPRRSKSIWSKINTGHIERLIKEGKMRPAGLKAVEDAKKDGRWINAYDSPANISLPEEFIKLLTENKKAKAFFDTLNKTNTYAIAWRIQTAKKPETKIRRMEKILEMLENGEKFH